jgi:hypothetical protein
MLEPDGELPSALEIEADQSLQEAAKEDIPAR